MTISIVVPVYNAASFIAEAIKSILSQTVLPHEIILIDDGSSDNSLQILNNFAKKHPLIKVYSQENSGPSVTRNRGVEYASSEWVCFVDADDLLHSQRLEIASYFAQGCDAVICNYLRFKKENEIPSSEFGKDKIKVSDSNESTRSVIQLGYGLPRMIMRREAFLDAGGLDETLINNEDHEFHFRMVTKGVRFKKIECPLYYYRQHDSTSRLASHPSRIKNTYQALYKMADQITNLDPNFQKLAQDQIGNRIANNALKQALSGDDEFMDHLKFAIQLNDDIKPYNRNIFNAISRSAGYGNLEKFIGIINKIVR